MASVPRAAASDGDRKPPARSGRAAIVAARATAILIGLLLPLVVLEVALRMFGPFLPGNYDTGSIVRRHPILGHFHTPSFRTWVKAPEYTVQVDFNPMGLRDPRQSYAKPPGTFRILALGDSFVEAAQVQANETVTARLEAMLGTTTSRPVEVINGGVLGYGTTQEYLLLDLEGPKYQPDLVLLFFCYCNDVANNNYRLDLINGDLNRALKPYFDLEDDSDELRLIPPPPPSPRTSVRERLRDISLLYNVIETGVVYKFELQNPQEPFNGIGGLEDPLRRQVRREADGGVGARLADHGPRAGEGARSGGRDRGAGRAGRDPRLADAGPGVLAEGQQQAAGRERARRAGRARPPARRDRAAARRAVRRSQACVPAEGRRGRPVRLPPGDGRPLDGSTGTSWPPRAWRPSWQSAGCCRASACGGVLGGVR